ncbi:hypothetical protein A6035_04155 [Dietzia lutea]|uniref:Htaa domain-containing protein n=2 Tax=Dietzia lutea TaxID=546160 RepID=A0A2S1R5F9_9ACTN|nr:hypothetical protein A6035_04155 [Dietzia lutea]
MGLSALAVPATAGAADLDCAPSEATYEVTGGSIKWGFKQSFRNYFYGFAHGTHTFDGVSFEGTDNATDGKYVWPVTAGTVDGPGSATASGEGSVNFNAHGGVLNTTISNPTVEIDGTAGVLKLDWEGNEFTTDEDAEPVKIGGEQVVAATFALPAASDFHAPGQITVTSPASVIGENFVPAFNNYPSGSALDPVTLVLDITATCEAAPGGDDGGDDDDDQGTSPEGIFGSLGTLFGSLGA